MQLAIFDLDGTLTRTTRVDEACFLRALHEEFGVAIIDNDWSNYTHSTDSGITAEIFQRQFGRAPTMDETQRFRNRFVALLADNVRSEPAACVEIAGASAALERLRTHAGWRLALATGSWRDSAMLKIRTARLACGDMPAAFADDCPDRGDIITLARSRAVACYRGVKFSRTVYVGDAPWDVRTSRRLGLPFLGVGGARTALRLRREGADGVIATFRDFDRLLEALTNAATPRTL